MVKEQLIELGVQKYLNGEGTLTELQKELHISKDLIKEKLQSMGYIIKKGMSQKSVVGLKKAIDMYKENINNSPSLTKIAKECGITRQCLSETLKTLGVDIINYLNQVRFNENVFDNIDTEEKAYWLGFIFADGCIESSTTRFSIALSAKDKSHLELFNTFMQYNGNNIKDYIATLNDKQFPVCKWFVKNIHLWNTLNSYGCTPRKSLVLKFPNESIFKDTSLIKHFIRGYVDGDGTLTYTDKEHKHPEFSVLGTEDFLEGAKRYLPIKFDYKLSYNDKQQSLITRKLQINGYNAKEICDFLYEDSKIYLTRKYNKYLEFCRLYEKSLGLLQDKIGEGCDANTEVSSEIAQGSEILLSVESE